MMDGQVEPSTRKRSAWLAAIWGHSGLCAARMTGIGSGMAACYERAGRNSNRDATRARIGLFYLRPPPASWPAGPLPDGRGPGDMGAGLATFPRHPSVSLPSDGVELRQSWASPAKSFRDR
jgi:hypothetical protein